MRCALMVHPAEPEAVLGQLQDTLHDDAMKETLPRRMSSSPAVRGRRAVRADAPAPGPPLRRVDAADVATLDAWAERVLSSSSLDEILA